MEVIQGLQYSENHHWVRVEGTRAVIGMTDFAQEEFGMVMFVELPEVGDTVQAGEPFGSMESVKTVTELYAPVSGTIVDTNQKLHKEPNVINMSPYGQGWLLVIEMSDSSELAQLWDAERYKATYIHE
ncbi:glycine cleavage system protein GcvH [Paenibacillus allorhizosphaerae]|uniref:Glycine cleavage system H protein n=1 Tax=Paenibacillus allorhizosphaerae TaxID=2849866 RepID=A0ABM8VK93_9BACL|nr:glycine cleavage system protein GcvH [Paenibacillus allorhizosphaerae]CAG7646690.1 Glycine cleavage system H protein [Paenibacillus allorhizosphaerae]